MSNEEAAADKAGKLKRWLENGKKCPKCGGKGIVMAYRPTIYCTDSPDEVADARRMAERPCPECPDFAWALAEIERLESDAKCLKTAWTEEIKLRQCAQGMIEQHAHEIEWLTRERDEARAEIRRRCQDLGNAEAEIDRMRAALLAAEPQIQRCPSWACDQEGHRDCAYGLIRAALAQATDGGEDA